MTKPQLFIFDFDGCLYPYPKDLVALLTTAVGRAGHEISNHELSEEQAEEICIASYRETGLSFKKLCEEYNVSLAEGFFRHHQHVHFDLEPDPTLIQALRDIDRDQTHLMILTHSSSCFLDRKLRMLELDQFFPHNMRISHDQYGFAMKHESPRGFVQALSVARMVTGLDFQAEDATMFEDTEKNLKIPHEMGMQTVLINQGKPVEHMQRYVSRQCQTVSTLLQERPQRPIPFTHQPS